MAMRKLPSAHTEVKVFTEGKGQSLNLAIQNKVQNK